MMKTMVGVRISALEEKQLLKLAKKIAGIKMVVMQSTIAMKMDACSEVAAYPGQSQTGMALMAGSVWVTMSIMKVRLDLFR